MEVQSGGYGDQDKDNDQPVESDPLPDDICSPTDTPPSTGPFSTQRQKAQAYRHSLAQAKIGHKAKKVGGPPE